MSLHLMAAVAITALTVGAGYLEGGATSGSGSGVVAALKQLRPDLQTHVLDAPHLVLQRRPAEAAARIAEFVLSLR